MDQSTTPTLRGSPSSSTPTESGDALPSSAVTTKPSESLDNDSQEKILGVGLKGSLFGFITAALIASSDYAYDKLSVVIPPELELNTIDNRLDIYRISDLAKSMIQSPNSRFFSAVNRDMHLDRLKKKLGNLRRIGASKFVYLAGHSERPTDGKGFNFLPDDYYQGAGHALPSKELSKLLIGPDETRMMLLTDFCYANNFLGLQWTLRRNTQGNLVWEESEEYDPSAKMQEHRILHYSACSKGQRAYGFSEGGSIFARAFYNAEHTGVDPNVAVPVSLLKRFQNIHSEVLGFIQKYNQDRSKEERIVQEPQLYASVKFDLDNEQTLPDQLCWL